MAVGLGCVLAYSINHIMLSSICLSAPQCCLTGLLRVISSKVVVEVFDGYVLTFPSLQSVRLEALNSSGVVGQLVCGSVVKDVPRFCLCDKCTDTNTHTKEEMQAQHKQVSLFIVWSIFIKNQTLELSLKLQELFSCFLSWIASVLCKKKIHVILSLNEILLARSILERERGERESSAARHTLIHKLNRLHIMASQRDLEGGTGFSWYGGAARSGPGSSLRQYLH